ncbi:MAG: anti-sigma factor [Planctomycetota bacterium]
MTDHRMLDRDPGMADLLVGHATEGLTRRQQEKLDELLRDHPGVEEDEFLEAASLVDLAHASRQPHAPLPGELRNRILEAHRARNSSDVAKPEVPHGVSPWWIPVSAAAAALIGITAFQSFRLTDDPITRAKLMAAGEATQWSWKPAASSTFAEVRGNVVWSPNDQAGFLTFHGLPALDPSAQQYQLWIVDATSQRKHPIDGGVFDHPGGDDPVVVPFEAKLEVFEATAFAITVEKPGGVVVSDGPLEIVAAGG